MRVQFAALCVLLAWHPALAQDPTDPYSVATMRSLLTSGNYLGALEKQNERMGDRAAIAALKIFDEAELTRPENVRKLLPILHESFAYPQLITLAEDRKPSVTLFLLHYLERNVPDLALKKQTAALEAFIKSQTAAKPRTTP